MSVIIELPTTTCISGDLIVEDSVESISEDSVEEIPLQQVVLVMEDGEIVMPGTGQVRDPNLYYDEDNDSMFSNVSSHTAIKLAEELMRGIYSGCI